jgi:hypothetical protein
MDSALWLPLHCASSDALRPARDHDLGAGLWETLLPEPMSPIKMIRLARPANKRCVKAIGDLSPHRAVGIWRPAHALVF